MEDDRSRNEHSRGLSTPPISPLAGWGGVAPRMEGTRSSLASWSWYDVARTLAGALAGALVGVGLATLLAPEAGIHPALAPRFLRGALLGVLWAAPLTAGLCLAAGQPLRAPVVWARSLVRALAVAALGAVAASALLALCGGELGSAGGPRFLPLAGWSLLGLISGLAFFLGFPRERHGPQTALTGLAVGVALGAVFPIVASTAHPLSGIAGRFALHLGALLPAGALMGLGQAIVRELGKREWLLVVFGDQPGRHYPLYGRPFTIGSSPDNDLSLDPTGMVQPSHAIIRRSEGQTVIEAQTPDALVFLDNSYVAMSLLYDGDELQIGQTVLRYYAMPQIQGQGAVEKAMLG